jgi:hypothetical protein
MVGYVSETDISPLLFTVAFGGYWYFVRINVQSDICHA